MSSMYLPEAYWLATFVIEIPWLILQTLMIVPVIYFMVRRVHGCGAFGGCC